MQMKICSALALAISAASLPLAYAADATSAPANGFLEESQLTLLSRNVALYRNLKNNSNAADNGGVNSSQNYVNEWGQAEMLTFTSGFTQGTVGFGVDAFANGAVRLTGGAGTGGSRRWTAHRRSLAWTTAPPVPSWATTSTWPRTGRA